MATHFEIYQTGGSGTGLLTAGMFGTPEWRWRLRAINGRIIADSGESYKNRDDCLAGIALVQGTSILTEIRATPS